MMQHRNSSQEATRREEDVQNITHLDTRFDLEALKLDYKANHSTWIREASKWAFGIGTLGIGALYLWMTTSIIKEGQIGLRRNARGELILLPPGRHSNFPWEAYETQPQSLSKNVLELGPYKIINVQTGYVAKTSRFGIVEILKPGQHILRDAAHKFDAKNGFISTLEETKTLPAVKAMTSNGVVLEIKADVRYKIDDPLLTITQVDEIENTIVEIAKFNIAQVVSHHSLSEFVPITMSEKSPVRIGADAMQARDFQDSTPDEEAQIPRKGLSKLLLELMTEITTQLKSRGIKLLYIGITSWDYADKVLGHEIGQGAVLEAKIRSSITAAEQAAKVTNIEAQAKADTQRKIAEGQADAVKILGQAYVEFYESTKHAPTTLQMWQTQQQVQMLGQGNNPHIIFQVGEPNRQIPMSLAITHEETSSPSVRQ